MSSHNSVTRDTMLIKINGEEHQIQVESTLGQLLEQLSLPLLGSAVELGGEIIPRSQYETTRLANGQSLEIIRLVGGG